MPSTKPMSVAKRSSERIRKRGGTASHRLYTPFPADRKERRQFRDKVRSYFTDEGDPRKWDAAEMAAAMRGLIMRVLVYADKQPSLITPEGRLLPVLDKSLGMLVNNWRRMVELLEALDAEAVDPLPRLEDYLQARAATSLDTPTASATPTAAHADVADTDAEAATGAPVASDGNTEETDP